MFHAPVWPSLPVITLAAIVLAGCGPESNSRYGDSYWDPWDTKDTFDPVDAPSYSVEFVDTDDSDGEKIYEARITLDATETYERVDYGYSWGFIRGTKERETLEPLGASSDLLLVYEQDPDDPSEDNRLVATTPGRYSIVFEGESQGPLGKVTFRFDDLSFTLPGCPSTFDYYADYVDDTLEACAECHQTGDPAGQLDLPDNDFDDRRRNFIDHVNNRIESTEEDLTLPEWAVNPSHLGSSTIDESSQAYRNLATFVSMLEEIKAGFADPNTNLASGNNSGGDEAPSEFCFSEPSGFAYTQE